MATSTGRRTDVRQYDPASETAFATTILPEVVQPNTHTSPTTAPTIDRNSNRPACTSSKSNNQYANRTARSKRLDATPHQAAAGDGISPARSLTRPATTDGGETD
ncbi:hypothetical protein ACFWPH_33600 [Nocardia sp. NPDC058499]|uniref:hypothetical protein n=1 Tax=Nocardia sp. NPDC058499 TaxID=3346530 RepID=UPI00365AF740